jgi:hypothetical protein
VNTWKSLLLHSSELLLSLIKLIYDLGFHTSEFCKTRQPVPDRTHKAYFPATQTSCPTVFVFLLSYLRDVFYKRSHALPCSIHAQTVFRSNPATIRIFLLTVLNVTGYHHQHHHHCYFTVAIATTTITTTTTTTTTTTNTF